MKKRASIPLEIFRAGKHTSASGETLNFSESTLRAIAKAYDPALHEAPIVIGHPKHDAPAFGWIGACRSKGPSLFGAARQVNADFAEAVKDGSYKKISASFYKPNSPSNPKPGQYYLRHVGFLGAQPPSVKGLAPVSFADSKDDYVSLDFAELDSATLFRTLREWMIGQFGLDEADKALPPGLVDWVQEDAAVQDATTVDHAEVEAAAEQAAEEVTDKVVEAAQEAVDEALAEQVAEAVAVSLATQLTDAVVTAVVAAIEGADAETVRAAVEPVIKTTLEGEGEASGAIETEIEKALEGAGETLHEAVQEAVKEALEPAIEHAVEAVAESAASDSADSADHAEPKTKSLAERKLEAREKQIAEREANLRRERNVSFLEPLLKEGKRLPAKKEIILDLLEFADSQDSSVSFSEEGKARKHAPGKLLRDLIKMLPNSVPLRSIGDPDGAEFSEDSDPSDVAAAAQKFQAEQAAKGVRVSTSDAVNHVKGR